MPEFVDRIFVVDDCSADKTSEVTQHWARRRGHRVELIRHDARGGVGTAITTGLLARLNVRNFRVADVHITPRYGIGERSSMKVWKVIPTVSYLLLRGFFYRMFEKYVIRDFHPLVFFYALGFLLTLIGLILGVVETIAKLSHCH